MNKHTTNLAPITVKRTSTVKKRLEQLGKIKRRSTHWLMKEALDSYLKREESAEQLKQKTLLRWEEAMKGQLISHEAVTQWLDTWGTDQETDRPPC